MCFFVLSYDNNNASLVILAHTATQNSLARHVFSPVSFNVPRHLDGLKKLLTSTHFTPATSVKLDNNRRTSLFPVILTYCGAGPRHGNGAAM